MIASITLQLTAQLGVLFIAVALFYAIFFWPTNKH